MQCSVIIPTFRDNRIAAALASIALQKNIQLEVIVVDGANEPEAFQSLPSYSFPVHFIHEKDNGVYDAMNKGISKAQGTWIYILGSDDVLANDNTLSNLISRGSQADIIFGNVENTGLSHSATTKIHIPSFPNGMIWKHTLHQQGVLYRRALFQERNFKTSYQILGDYEFHFHLKNKNVKVEYVNETVARCDANGLSKRYVWKLYKEEIRLKKEHLNALEWLMVVPFVISKYVFKNLTK
jgi:glycosyltransferase involved in cell wall biosynthesis